MGSDTDDRGACRLEWARKKLRTTPGARRRFCHLSTHGHSRGGWPLPTKANSRFLTGQFFETNERRFRRSVWDLSKVPQRPDGPRCSFFGGNSFRGWHRKFIELPERPIHFKQRRATVFQTGRFNSGLHVIVKAHPESWIGPRNLLRHAGQTGNDWDAVKRV